MSNIKDITGQRFEDLEALNFEYSKNGVRYWRFRCKCGREIVVRKSSVTSKNTTGCKECSKIKLSNMNKTHGMSRTRLYKEWAGIIQRCNNPKSTSYERYGARGITICKEWMKFETFRDWALSNGYSDELTIDRKDVNGNYCPENCKWSTTKEQSLNKRNSRKFTYDGKTMTMSEWAKEIGISSSSLFGRLKRGWSIEKALSTPPITEMRNKNYGKNKQLSKN